MTTYLKTAIKRSVAENLLTDLTQARNNYFFFVAKSSSWADENTPSPYIDSDKSERTVSRSIIGYKRINSSNVLFAIPRYDWVLGETYDQYDDAVDLFDKEAPKTFYVFTNQNHIYKCLYNANNSPSTSQPSSVLSTAFRTADNYIWKYLGTVKESDMPSSLSDYLPINHITNSTDIETQNQYNTQIQAVDGAITRIDVKDVDGVSAGVYTHAVLNSSMINGLRVSRFVASTSLNESLVEITDPASVAIISDLEQNASNGQDYNGTQMFSQGYILRVVENDSSIGEINNYGIIVSNGVTGSTNSGRYFTVRNDVNELKITVPVAGAPPIVEVLPFIKITGDGSDAYAFPKMTGVVRNYTIDEIDVISGGRNYSHALINIIPPTLPQTVKPVATAVLSPKGGHSSNILRELNADRVILIVEITETDEKQIIPGGSYRQFGIVKNPTLLNEKGTLAGAGDICFRDIVLTHENSSNTTSLANSVFGGSDTVMIIGGESFSASKVHSLKSSNSTTKRIVIKTQNVTDDYVTYQDRPNDYLLSLNNSGAIFKIGEKIVQHIPVGTTFTVAGSSSSDGVSFAYGILSEGVVLNVSDVTIGGYTLGVRSTKNSFAISSVAGLTGDISGATGTINEIRTRSGEYITTVQLTGGLTFSTDKVFKILETGLPYFDEASVSRYIGLHGLKLATSANGVTGAIDTTTASFTPTSFLSSQIINQGEENSYKTDYASGIVYAWDYINTTSGILWTTEVVGKFKNVADNGLTGSNLGAYIISGVSLPDIDPNSGEMLYIDSVRSVDRVVGQNEEFRLTIGF